MDRCITTSNVRKRSLLLLLSVVVAATVVVVVLLTVVGSCLHRRRRRRRRLGFLPNEEHYRILSTTTTTNRKGGGPKKSPPTIMRVAIVCMLRRPVVDWPLWFQHHRSLGVCHFYVRLEDTPGVGDILRGWSDVTCVEAGRDDDGGVDAAAWGNNVHERMARRQDAWVRRALEWALARGTADWLVHIDGDELLHGTLAALDALGRSGVVCARLRNAEAVYDDPAAQDREGCYAAVKFRRCGEGRPPCRAYTPGFHLQPVRDKKKRRPARDNGKSAARVLPGVIPWGPHQFAFQGQSEGPHVVWVPFEQLCVLHFDVCTFGAWAEKFWPWGII